MTISKACVGALFLALGLCSSSTRLLAASNKIAFVDVNVIPMDREIIVPHQTVIVGDGKIIASGATQSVKIPDDAQRINGNNRYLMPGLADMHMHFIRPATSGLFQASASEHFDEENRVLALLYLANGVTTVRNLWGHPAILSLAKDIDSGRVLGPHIYSAGPVTDGSPVQWPGSRAVDSAEQAQKAVLSDKQAGYIAIKVYDGLSKDAYEAIVAAAKQQHLAVVGHVPEAVGLAGVLAAHQDSIEHIYYILPALQPNPVAETSSDSDLLKRADLRKLPELAHAIKTAGSWYCPTLVAYARTQRDRVWLQQQKLVPPAIVLRYQKGFSGWDEDPLDSPEARPVYLKMVAALHEAGVGLLLGTDAYKPSALPGSSLHDELANFVSAGMTPYEALRAGTIDAARFLHREEEFGTIAVGRRADLLLLTANPLADVGNAAKRVGVMVQGKWFSEGELENKRKQLASTHSAD
jgi:imidazolonepropionase-like amidohydrolase